MSVQMPVHTSVLMSIRMSIHVSTHTSRFMPALMPMLITIVAHVHTHLFTHIYMHVYTRVCTHISAYVCPHVYTRLCTCLGITWHISHGIFGGILVMAFWLWHISYVYTRLCTCLDKGLYTSLYPWPPANRCKCRYTFAFACLCTCFFLCIARLGIADGMSVVRVWACRSVLSVFSKKKPTASERDRADVRTVLHPVSPIDERADTLSHAICHN